MLKVVCDGPVRKCLEEWFDCSYPLQIRLFKESLSHGLWNIKENGYGLFGVSCNDWFEIFLVNDLLNIFTGNIGRHEIQIHRLLLPCENIVDVVGFGNIFIFADEHSEFSFLCF